MAVINVLMFGPQTPVLAYKSDAIPRVGEYIEQDDQVFIVHEVIHTEHVVKIMVRE